jgi:hypothetical protein
MALRTLQTHIASFNCFNQATNQDCMGPRRADASDTQINCRMTTLLGYNFWCNGEIRLVIGRRERVRPAQKSTGCLHLHIAQRITVNIHRDINTLREISGESKTALQKAREVEPKVVHCDRILNNANVQYQAIYEQMQIQLICALCRNCSILLTIALVLLIIVI